MNNILKNLPYIAISLFGLAMVANFISIFFPSFEGQIYLYLVGAPLVIGMVLMLIYAVGLLPGIIFSSSSSFIEKKKCHHCDGVVKHGHGPSGEFCSDECWKIFRYAGSFKI